MKMDAFLDYSNYLDEDNYSIIAILPFRWKRLSAGECRYKILCTVYGKHYGRDQFSYPRR